MENQEIQISERALTAVDVRKQVNLIQSVMKEVMKDGTHYGVVPGCGDKKTLLKSGAEVLGMTFRLAPEYEELSGSYENDIGVFYKIDCKLVHIPTGQVVGHGRGICSSREKKYKTRSVYFSKATDEEKTIGKLSTRMDKYGKSYDVVIVPQDPWDVANTVYKMACKRAQVAAILNATAASDMFTQDIEDLPDGTVIEDELKSGKPVVAMPQEKVKEEKPVTNGNVTSSPIISEPQAKRLYAIAKGSGYEDSDIKEYLKNKYGIESSRDIVREHYDDIVSHFQTKKA